MYTIKTMFIDEDSAGSLECFQWKADEAIPGCYEGAIVSLNGPGNNYCYDSQIDKARTLR